MATKTRPNGLHCFACRRDGFKRRDLTPDFLCAECRKIPGVRGYIDPNKRGLSGNGGTGEKYWNDTLGQLHVIGADEPGSEPASDGTPPATIGGTLQEWQRDVLGSDLPDGVKIALIRLSLWADWGTGANCFPSRRAVAEALRISVATAWKQLERGASQGWLIVCEVRRGNERLSNHYVLRWPDGRKLSGADRRRVTT